MRKGEGKSHDFSPRSALRGAKEFCETKILRDEGGKEFLGCYPRVERRDWGRGGSAHHREPSRRFVAESSDDVLLFGREKKAR